MSVVSVAPQKKAAGVNSSDLRDIVVAHTGLEPVVSALRGQRVSRLHQCAAADSHYRFAAERFASCSRGIRRKAVNLLYCKRFNAS